jgi:hypothetical protein
MKMDADLHRARRELEPVSQRAPLDRDSLPMLYRCGVQTAQNQV